MWCIQSVGTLNCLKRPPNPRQEPLRSLDGLPDATYIYVKSEGRVKKGYWMVVLHPDSRKLTCMALPFGRFQWTHLPMGTVVAQDIFQSKLDAIFIGMEGVTRLADDMIIAGKDEMEHDRNFLAFMEKCLENNLTLNSERIQFKQSQVSSYGHIWSEHRISPDTKKIQALKHVEFPPDKETMRSFLGMINYLNRYSVLSAHLAATLR